MPHYKIQVLHAEWQFQETVQHLSNKIARAYDPLKDNDRTIDQESGKTEDKKKHSDTTRSWVRAGMEDTKDKGEKAVSAAAATAAAAATVARTQATQQETGPRKEEKKGAESHSSTQPPAGSTSSGVHTPGKKTSAEEEQQNKSEEEKLEKERLKAKYRAYLTKMSSKEKQSQK